MHQAIGRQQVVHDAMDPARAAALHRVLARPGNPPRADTPLPPFFHQVYFWETRAPQELGRDGHPATGGFVPDLGLPRRMWAGGRLTFSQPLRAGQPAEKASTISDVVLKEGKSGPLGFVTLRHEFRQNGVLCVTEEQDLVYRPLADPNGVAPALREAPADCAPTALSFDPVLLFRYSALTMNGHRIHYDADYAREAEGYAGLVVHGPLLAQSMMIHASSERPLASFRFRGTAPLICGTPAVMCHDEEKIWIRRADGGLIMEGTATWQDT